VGSNHTEAASGLMALSIAMGSPGSASAWSREGRSARLGLRGGAALLAATGPASGGFPAAVDAGRMVAAIPRPLTNAVSAGVLFGLCLAPIQALMDPPVGARLIVLDWHAVEARVCDADSGGLVMRSVGTIRRLHDRAATDICRPHASVEAIASGELQRRARGVTYVVFGLLACAVTAFVAGAPIFVEA
jgi:predicted benzoate:H+ symporter BenE